MKKIGQLLFLSLILSACGSSTNTHEKVDDGVMVPIQNEPSELADEVIAKALIDSMVNACGGMQAWKSTQFLTWDFFGARKVWWDKAGKQVRIESARTDFKAIIQTEKKSGKIFVNGEVITQSDSLKKYVDVAFAMWNNDKYWVAMPFLANTAESLHYQGAKNASNGSVSEIVQVQFGETAGAPFQKFELFLNPQDYKLQEWACYTADNDTVPTVIAPWKNYTPYGAIQLSLDRGVRQFPELSAPKSLPASLFQRL